MTEKSTRTHDLNEIKRLINDGDFYIRSTARKDALSLGFSDTELVEIILSLGNCDFYRSKTDYNNHREWHDIYKCEREGRKLYIKFKTGRSNSNKICIITSFKRDEEGTDV